MGFISVVRHDHVRLKKSTDTCRGDMTAQAALRVESGSGRNCVKSIIPATKEKAAVLGFDMDGRKGELASDEKSEYEVIARNQVLCSKPVSLLEI